jgi:voltage-gated potassium channel
MAIIDLLSILPSLLLISDALKVLKAIRFSRALRVLKIFKSFRYSKNIAMIANVFREQRKSLVTVCALSCGYILLSAIAVFNAEPETFDTFFDAVYWATVSLTTVGYGDIYTVSVLGRIITMISSVLGVAVVALPAGIVTAGYMKALERAEEEEREAKTRRDCSNTKPCSFRFLLFLSKPFLLLKMFFNKVGIKVIQSLIPFDLFHIK